jgi:hypothetical protein
MTSASEHAKPRPNGASRRQPDGPAKRRLDGSAEKPVDADTGQLPTFCNTWPWPSSDLDLVLPKDNAAVHRARGCCQGGSDAK